MATTYTSPFPSLPIPKTNFLTYLYPPNTTASSTPLWIDASDPRKILSPRQALSWIRRLAAGLRLDALNIPKSSVILIFTPNHIFVPVAYQGIVGSGRIFCGVILVHPSLVGIAVKAAGGVGLSRDRIFLFSDDATAGLHCSDFPDVSNWKRMVASEAKGAAWKWDELSGESITSSSAASTIATVNYSSGTHIIT
ncbi:hypothetical protein BJY00DRAFT_319305 [Aspergillus carlsbadensis]|nr:hypothetical protein BJY00DRAFT_319305 [Aspergillus carlsbadensis]